MSSSSKPSNAAKPPNPSASEDPPAPPDSSKPDDKATNGDKPKVVPQYLRKKRVKRKTSLELAKVPEGIKERDTPGEESTPEKLDDPSTEPVVTEPVTETIEEADRENEDANPGDGITDTPGDPENEVRPVTDL